MNQSLITYNIFRHLHTSHRIQYSYSIWPLHFTTRALVQDVCPVQRFNCLGF